MELLDELPELNDGADVIKPTISGSIWLPPTVELNRTVLLNAAVLPVVNYTTGATTYVRLIEENGENLVVPRHFFETSTIPDTLVFEKIDFEKYQDNYAFKDSVVLRDKDQIKAWKAFGDADHGILNLGCVAGSTRIGVNRAGKGFSTTIARAFRSMSGGRYAWDAGIPTRVRSNVGDRVGLNDVVRIVHSGVKNTLTLLLENGYTLRTTEDHEVQTTQGYLPLGGLTPEHTVVVAAPREKSIKKPKQVYRRLSWYPAHPHVRKQRVAGGRIKYQIEEHRAVLEAHINGITLDDYRRKLKLGIIENLEFINPEKYHVHHIDGNIHNNVVGNLEILDRETHLAKHRPGAKAFGYTELGTSRVVSVTPHGIEPVYDIVCVDPHRNFVANGIVVHNCGKGKSVLGLKKIASRGKAALVIVNNGGLVDQWVEKAKEFLGLTDNDIGIVQGVKQEWGKPLVIAMLQTLSSRIDTERDIPIKQRLRFGTIIFDEVHHMSANTFIRVASRFFGSRFGLTATVERVDGLEGLYMAHLGPLLYTDLSQTMNATIVFRSIQTKLDLGKHDIIGKRTGKVSFGRLNVVLSQIMTRNMAVLSDALVLLKEGRKVLVLGHAKDHPDAFKALVAKRPAFSKYKVGYVMQSSKNAERTAIIKESDITFSTMGIAKEGLDVPTLDSILFVTPFRTWGAFQQGKGRIERWVMGKKQPIAVVYVDQHIPPAKALCMALKREITKRGLHVYSKDSIDRGPATSPDLMPGMQKV